MGRLNTFRISYGNLPNKPSLSQVQKFCANELGLRKGDVLRIQNSRALAVTFVTVIDLDLARKVCEEHGRTHDVHGTDGKEYPVTITLEDGAVDVRIYDLSADVSDADVHAFLSRYGTVRSIYEEQLGDDQDFAGAFTGIRIAKMVVEENIDSWVTINGELTQVTYFGQRQTCRHCREYLHIGATCVQNKKLLVQKTYADAAKMPAKPKPRGQPPKTHGKKRTSTQGGASLQPPIGTKPSLPAITKPTTDNSSAGSSQLQEGSSFLQPAAPNSQPTNGSITPAQGHLFNSQHAQTRKSAAGKFDGNDTDSSVASNASKRSGRRPANKKLKSSDNEREEEEEP